MSAAGAGSVPGSLEFSVSGRQSGGPAPWRWSPGDKGGSRYLFDPDTRSS
ncbi:MAG: hypothetical protein LC729_03430 [Acidobacteria bacterium]|nr:hypothetical protein [Acidobacteriota bacterium]